MSFSAIATSCTKLRWPGRADIWVKNEAQCPTGTFKDRLASELSQRLGPADESLLISCITLGNTLASLTWALRAGPQGRPRPQLLGVFPSGFSGRTIGPNNHGQRMQGQTLLDRLRRTGVVCVEHDLASNWIGPRDIAQLGRAAGMRFSQHRDVTNGIEVPSYECIVREALGQCGVDIDIVLVPVGAGVLFEESVRFLEQTSPRTRVIGVTTLNPRSCADKIYAAYSPYMRDLVARGTAHFPGLPRHPVIPLEDGAIIDALTQLPPTLRAEPSAAAAFAALDDYRLVPPNATVLVINTGDGIVAGDRPWP